MESINPGQLDYVCSFCGKDQRNHGVRVVPGPCVYICEECVDMCSQILEAWPKVVCKEITEKEPADEENT